MSAAGHIPNETSRLTLAWSIPSLSGYHATLAKALLKERLDELIRQEQGIAYNIQISAWDYLDCGLFQIETHIPHGCASSVETTCLRHLEAITSAEQEFLQRKQAMLDRFLYHDLSASELFDTCMDDLLQYQRLVPYIERFAIVKGTTFADFTDYVTHYLSDKRMCSVLLCP